MFRFALRAASARRHTLRERHVNVKGIIKTIGVTLVTMIVINNGVKYLPASVQRIVKGQ